MSVSHDIGREGTARTSPPLTRRPDVVRSRSDGGGVEDACLTEEQKSDDHGCIVRMQLLPVIGSWSSYGPIWIDPCQVLPSTAAGSLMSSVSPQIGVHPLPMMNAAV